MGDGDRLSPASPLLVLSQVVEGLAPDTFGAVDTELRYLALNSASRAQLKALYGRDYDVGDRVTDGLSPEMAEASTALWQRALSGESWVDEVTFGDLEQHVFRSRFFPLRSDLGEVIGAAGWGSDVTAAVRARQELAEANATLEQFVYLASHDLKTPVRGIRTYTMFLRRAAERGDSEQVLEMVANVEGQLDRIEEQIRDLLTWTRMRKSARTSERIDLAGLVQEVLGRLDGMITERAASITLEPLGTVVGDRAMLREALQNLVENAIKYSDDPPVVTIRQTVEPVAAIQVSDEGIGIDARYVEKIWGFFSRLHGEDDYGGGTGAGLGIVAEVAAQLGGTATVESTPGAGSTFSLALPGLTPPAPTD